MCIETDTSEMQQYNQLFFQRFSTMPDVLVIAENFALSRERERERRRSRERSPQRKRSRERSPRRERERSPRRVRRVVPRYTVQFSKFSLDW